MQVPLPRARFGCRGTPLFDHQPGDDLRLHRVLQRHLDGQQLLLVDEEGEEADLEPV